MSLVDIGANLVDRSFDGDRDAVIARAVEAGVGRIVVTGSSLEVSAGALELARSRPGVLFATAGVHPHHAHSCNERTVPTLRELALAPEVVAVGECGLDYFRDLSPRPDQRRWFEAQIGLAVELDMPLFMHDRDAHEDMLAILRLHRDAFGRGVVHCFTGDEAALRAYLDLDLHIGITGWICDERRGAHLRDLVALVPRERLMIETDAPYLMPRTIRPRPKTRRNEPCNLVHVRDAVASSLGVSVEEIAETTARTAEQFFGLGCKEGS